MIPGLRAGDRIAVDQAKTLPREAMRPPDQELMTRLRAGDPTVLRALLARYLGPLSSYAERTLGGMGDPQDTVQEAFIRLWTYRERWRPDGSIRALLYTITRNAALDELRRRQKEVPFPQGSDLPFSGGGSDPLAHVVEGELFQMADDAISRLPPRRQEVFRLIREGGLSYNEVAEVLGLSPQTVANLMSLALANLRTSLAPVLRSDPTTPTVWPPPRRTRHASGSD